MLPKAKNTVVLKHGVLHLVLRDGTANWQINYKSQSTKKWIRKSSGTDDLDQAKELAEDFAADVRSAERRGMPVLSKKFKAVAELVRKELEEKIVLGTSKRIYKDYVQAIDKYLIPILGSYNIDGITPQVVIEFEAKRIQIAGRKLKHSTHHTHELALNRIFDFAIEKGYLSKKDKPKVKNTGESGEARGFFTHEELIGFVEFLKKWSEQSFYEKTRALRELLVLYVLFVANTGARPGTELRELKWRHIEFIKTNNMRVIHIHLPQGKVGARTLIARNELWLVLEKLRSLHAEFAELTLDQLVEAKHDAYVFRMRDGDRPYSFVSVFAKGIRQAKMLTNGRDKHQRSLYSLRHYYATQRILEGYTYEELESQMGTSAEMMRDHYNHMKPLMIAEKLAGGSASTDAEYIKYMDPSRANMMSLIAAGTGIYLPLPEQNPDATRELEQELLSNISKKS